jgi:TM2 domain-containing membrane protein YozV
MDNIVDLLVLLGIMFLFFLLGRELVCWYFKINKTVELLEEIRDSPKNKS